MSPADIRTLVNFFLFLGNGDTFKALRGFMEEVESGVPLENVFQRIVEEARLRAEKAEEEEGAFSSLKEWVVIACNTGEDSDLMRIEDLLPKIKSSSQRPMAKRLLVKALAKSGHLEDARTMAGNIRNSYWRAEAWLEVHNVSNDPSDLRAAEEAAKLIEASEAREEVLAQIRAAKHKK
jgi:hypothetical protein